MPRGDRTGPEGMGPMTGRGAGYCAGNAVPGFNNPGVGRGGFIGGGRGRGRGFRNQYYATGMTGWQRNMAGAPGAFPLPAAGEGERVSMLREQIRNMEQALENLRAQIAELGGRSGE